MSDYPAGNRPALTGTAPGEAETEIEVTPAMIEAGISAVRSFEPFFDLSPGLEKLLVKEILEAAFAVG